MKRKKKKKKRGEEKREKDNEKKKEKKDCRGVHKPPDEYFGKYKTGYFCPYKKFLNLLNKLLNKYVDTWVKL